MNAKLPSCVVVLAISYFSAAHAGTIEQPSFKVYKSFSELQADKAKSCYIITSDCVTCAIASDGSLACSNPGIACEPSEWHCYQMPNRRQEK